MKEDIKKAVYKRIAGSQTWYPSGRAKIRVGQDIVHVRFCSTNRRSPSKYKFNINPNTLTADFELWICGDEETYFLIPIEIIKEIYRDPDTYQDYHHEGIKVVSIWWLERERELHMWTEKNFKVMMTFERSVEEQIADMIVALQDIKLKRRNFDYIDLRVKDKVFVKPR